MLMHLTGLITKSEAKVLDADWTYFFLAGFNDFCDYVFFTNGHDVTQLVFMGRLIIIMYFIGLNVESEP